VSGLSIFLNLLFAYSRELENTERFLILVFLRISEFEIRVRRAYTASRFVHGRTIMKTAQTATQLLSLRDQVDKAPLPRRIKKILKRYRIKTFRGIAVRKPHTLFDMIVKTSPSITPKELLTLNEQLVLRGIPAVTSYQDFEAGPGKLPMSILQRLWEERVYTTGPLETKNLTQLSLLVGPRNVPRLLRYLKTVHEIDPTEYVTWYTDQGFPRSAIVRLDMCGLLRVKDLFTATQRGRCNCDLRAESRTTRDNARTALYTRWWLTTKHPRSCSKLK